MTPIVAWRTRWHSTRSAISPPSTGAIGAVSKRPLDRIDPRLLDLLRVGTMELGRGDRPDALIVDAVVIAAKGLDQKFTGFANGVLRSLGRRGVHLKAEVPGWLRDELSRVMDDVEIGRFWNASLETPQVGVRSGDGTPPGGVPVPGIVDAWLVDGPAPPGSIVQDPASVAVGAAVEAGAGERILDAAAAPGGKTRQLIDAGADVVAIRYPFETCPGWPRSGSRGGLVGGGRSEAPVRGCNLRCRAGRRPLHGAGHVATPSGDHPSHGSWRRQDPGRDR